MTDSLVKSLGVLARERKTLHRKEQQLEQRQQQLIKELGRMLQGLGYRLARVAPSTARRTGSSGWKPLKCPKCDRRFAHPLPMARHLRATHERGRKNSAGPARRKVKKAA